MNSVCRAPPLPFPRQAASAARLNDRVIVCGGNDGLYERYCPFTPNEYDMLRIFRKNQVMLCDSNLFTYFISQ